MSDTAIRVETALRSLALRGWRLIDGPRGAAGCWQLAHRDNPDCVLYVGLNDYWLYFTLPLIHGAAPTFYECLQRCRQRFLCKYSLDASGQLALQLELPTMALERSAIYMAVDALNTYAELSGPAAGPASLLPQPDVEFFPAQTLDAYFKSLVHDGWAWRDKGLGKNHFCMHYAQGERPFDIYLSFNASWAYFQCPMLNESLTPIRPDHERLCRYLLQLNEQIYWARFGLDEEGQVLLLLDVPLQALTAERFRWAGQTLANYAVDYAFEIQIMAEIGRDPELAALLPAPSD